MERRSRSTNRGGLRLGGGAYVVRDLEVGARLNRIRALVSIPIWAEAWVLPAAG